MNPTPVTSKTEMYRRLNAGMFGHTLPAVETIADAEALMRDSTGKFAIRYKTSGGNTRYNLTPEQVLDSIRKLAPGSWNVTPMLDNGHRVCYGHLLDEVGGWRLHYSPTPKPCKLLPHLDGCEERHLCGLSARMYLKGIMDSIGWETLERLVDEYPYHVIEFSVMADRRHAFGPSNTIFWEVRCTTGEYERHSGWAKV